MSAPYRLLTPHFELSAPTRSDLDRIVAICDDPQVARWMALPAPYTKLHAEAFLVGRVIPGWADDTSYTWGIRPLPQRRLDGAVSLRFDGSGSADLGFYVASDARNSGLCTAAVRRVLAEAFDPSGLGLERVVWRAVVGNWASRRVAWKCGFHLDGTIRRDLHGPHGREDAWVATLLTGEPLRPCEPWAGPDEVGPAAEGPR